MSPGPLQVFFAQESMRQSWCPVPCGGSGTATGCWRLFWMILMIQVATVVKDLQTPCRRFYLANCSSYRVRLLCSIDEETGS